MKYVTKSMNVEFRAIMARRSNPKGFMLLKVLRDGRYGKPRFYACYGSESTAADVIKRLEQNNPGQHWVEAW